MEKNGQNSCMGNSLHKNTWYFFVKERLDKKDIAIVHCTNEVMLVNYFTKILQGRLFNMFMEFIMG